MTNTTRLTKQTRYWPADKIYVQKAKKKIILHTLAQVLERAIRLLGGNSMSFCSESFCFIVTVNWPCCFFTTTVRSSLSWNVFIVLFSIDTLMPRKANLCDLYYHRPAPLACSRLADIGWVRVWSETKTQSCGLYEHNFYHIVTYLISNQSFIPCMTLNSLSVLLCR